MREDNNTFTSTDIESMLKNSDVNVPEGLRPESIERKLAMMTPEEMDRRETSEDIPDDYAGGNGGSGSGQGYNNIYGSTYNEYTSDLNQSGGASADNSGVTKNTGKSGPVVRATSGAGRKSSVKWFVPPIIIAAAAMLIFAVGATVKIARNINKDGSDDANTITVSDETDDDDADVQVEKITDDDSDKNSKSDDKDTTESTKDDDSSGGLFGGKKKNYSKAYNRYKDYKDYMEDTTRFIDYDYGDDYVLEEAAEADGAAMNDTAKATLTTGSAVGAVGSSGSNDVSFTDTNVRTEGVAEADIIKTDGKYIYEYDSYTEHLVIYSVNDGEIEKVGKENILEDDMSFNEMYIYGDYLVLMGEYDKQFGYYSRYNANNTKTTISIYDISDREDPELVDTITQAGNYNSSRMVDGILYTFTYKYFDYNDVKKKNYDTFIPDIDGELIDDDNIYIQDGVFTVVYTVISSIDIEKSKIIDSAGIMAGDDVMYVSSDNIYLTDREWSWTSFGYEDNSKLIRVSYDDGEFEIEANGTFPGYLNDDYSIDEYKGYVRLVTTYYDDYTQYNGLYIYDEDLNKVSVIKKLAEGETIRSARFMGDTGYFVTFRNTDPLFAVDLSDPEDPEIMDYLKIPGFSAYLHPYGDDKLLGIGYDTDEWGFANCIKISMFDVSDPYDIEEVDKKLLYNFDTASVLENRNAFMFDTEDGRFGFSAYGDRSYLFDEGYSYYDDEAYDDMRKKIDKDINGSYYLVFDYDDKDGFEMLMQENIDEENGYYNNLTMDTRGIIIGDYLYVAVAGEGIKSYDTDRYKLVDSCD